jgi:hypothetical protein
MVRLLVRARIESAPLVRALQPAGGRHEREHELQGYRD